MDSGGAVATADDAADGDDGDIDHQVPAIARVARVVERFEVGADGADVDELGHGRHPLDRSASAAAPNRGVRPSDRHDRDKDIEAKAVAPDYSTRTVMRAGPGNRTGPRTPFHRAPGNRRS